ncbi:hypothetical protein WN944_012681 [Citrus x changshan-huyou]|uniref:Myb-like domain-containing protein n=2 Tax=Citrus TaxID=2706 RepID=A0A067GG05_CITSI|nr:trihelix transcription factor GT-2 [Citrus sinensis]XP_006467270.2 trihelix transcription factor GT-2 [Citrus sinensis]KAH9749933.1 Myb-like domain-containing protein [Citrus sinensis]KDO78564.1 hypothetical protein CISIN_1g017956mg [Citrus sinensis]
MEIRTGDRESEFPQQITPFPESINQPPVTESVNAPLQKLRPIRRSPADDPPSFEAAADKSLKFGSGSVAESLGPMSMWFDTEDESSSSSDSDIHVDLFTEIKEPGSQKRKRKTRVKIETFLESLVMKIMDKQEQMNKQLIDMIAKRERERVIREEAWKQQEMERMKRDEEIRAQETARSIALISFIQNFLGHEIQLPQPAMVSNVEENGSKDGRNHAENNITQNANNRKWPEACDPNRRWPEAEIQALIMLRTTLEHQFHGVGSKFSLWERISDGMRKMGYHRSAKKCKEKWENMNKYFRKSMENGKKHLERSKTCQYFHDLEMYRNGLVNPGNVTNFPNFENFSESDASNFTNQEIAAKIED